MTGSRWGRRPTPRRVERARALADVGYLVGDVADLAGITLTRAARIIAERDGLPLTASQRRVYEALNVTSGARREEIARALGYEFDGHVADIVRHHILSLRRCGLAVRWTGAGYLLEGAR